MVSDFFDPACAVSCKKAIASVREHGGAAFSSAAFRASSALWIGRWTMTPLSRLLFRTLSPAAQMGQSPDASALTRD